jgi:hypothetical protein
MQQQLLAVEAPEAYPKQQFQTACTRLSCHHKTWSTLDDPIVIFIQARGGALPVVAQQATNTVLYLHVGLCCDCCKLGSSFT